MFVGRDEELQFLNRHFAREGSQVLVVYGARGVGKTRLLREFTKDRESVSYAARACSDREQRFLWGRELKEEGYDIPDYPEYEEIFAAILPDTQEKKVLVLDEFQHLIKGEGHFFEALISFLENRRMSRPIMVVLLSSASGWVENSLVGRLGGAAAYISGFLKLRELTFPEITELFYGYDTADAMCHYAILGGIPGLWCSFSKELNARENIIQNLLKKESRLYEEMSVYLAEELREPAVYNTILAAVAAGNCKLNDIYLHTGFPRAKISVYLKNLMELDLVEKIYAGVYRIQNPYVRFYFRFLFPNLSLLEKSAPEDFYRLKVEKDLPAFMEESYRQICRQLFEKELPTGLTVSPWMGKDYCIDMVGVDGDNRRVVGACSYSRMMTVEDCAGLLSHARKAKILADRVLLYSEKGFTEELKLAQDQGKLELRSIIGTE
ncbi:MAG: ATP-binding protein [Lachnospiraceae bacterium]|nr:ATP-binding protein [Lachnospiraceae bacterium]